MPHPRRHVMAPSAWIISLGLAALPASMPAQAGAQDTIRFEPTVGYPTFAVREPVLTVSPGVTLISRTNHGGYYTPENGSFPGEVGPIYVEGATTNDILVVRIIEVRPTTSTPPPTSAPRSADSRWTTGCGSSTTPSPPAATCGA